MDRKRSEAEARRRLLEALDDKIARAAVPQPGPHYPVDSDEAKLEMARWIYRDAMNREPDFQETQ